MAQTGTESLTSIDQLDWVVDTDAHVLESVDDMLRHFDDRYEGAYQIVSNAKRPRSDVYSVTHGLPSRAMFRSDYDSDVSAQPRRHLDDDYSARDKLAEMAEFGIDFGVLDPTLNLGLSTVEHPEIACALANAYNSWLLDEYLDDEDEFVANILVAPQKPDVAAEEIDDRADEEDMVGVTISSTGVIPPLGDPRYDPIYQAASDNDLPVAMHGGNGATFRMIPTQRQFNQNYTENHVLVHPVGHLWHLTTMMTRGVFDRFPDVDFVFQESGIGWVPYAVWRLDDHYLLRPYEFHGSRAPSEVVEDQCYFTTQPLGHTMNNPEHLAWMIEMAGADSIMYASDLPHSDFDPPTELFDRVKDYFDAETVRGMMGETALDVFDIRT